jgi:hypothetical protein
MQPVAHRRLPAGAQRGAVNTMWVIVLFIVWLVSLGMWYVANADADDGRRAAAQARADLAEVQPRFDAALQAHEDLSAIVGYRDASVTGAKSDVVAIQADLAAVQSALGNADGAGGGDTLAQAVATLRTALSGCQQQLASTQADFQGAIAARQAAETNVNSVESNYQGQLAALNQQLRDEQQRADNQSQTDSARFDELVSAQQSADAAAREAQQALADLELQARRNLATADATIKALEVKRAPEAPEALDGKVLSVGGGGTVAFIDIGGRSGLKRGTRFEVLRPGKAGTYTPRGTVEVREVESDMAMVGLLGEADPFDPMLPGDAVRNPHFEAGRVVRFHLLGDFPLTMSKEFVTTRLTELGAAVDETLDTGTDVLVVGEKSLAEGEFAPELTDTDEYKLADKLGMRIIRLEALAEFLRY